MRLLGFATNVSDERSVERLLAPKELHGSWLEAYSSQRGLEWAMLSVESKLRPLAIRGSHGQRSRILRRCDR